ncbi:MAG: agmatinase [Nitrososphaerota archaeon]|nr:agmatinase [Candidatus Calditenuaceae archaeon]MDW8073062.1 agmatinase [Nitrososphaerota archaeon]
MSSASRGSKRLYPADSLSSPRFTGPYTFARLPQTRELEGVDALFIGIPFDCGVVFRPGARFGPGAVRQASLLLRLYNPRLKVRPFDVLNVADYSDIEVVPGSIDLTYRKISDALKTIVEGGVTPVVCGGDHSITLPVLREVSKRFGRLALIHVDAHLDTVDQHFSQKYTHGTVVKRALEEKLIDPHRSVHVGIRGSLFSEEELEEAKSLSFTVLTMQEIEDRGLDSVCEEIKKKAGDGPAYLTFDIDVCDPSCAPGTGTPEVGGLTSREALKLVDSLESLDIVGFDLVEVSPPYDHGEITALLAANIIYEFLSLTAHKRICRKERLS